MDKKTWIIDEVNKEWGHNNGVLHATQYCLTSVKGQTNMCANCTTFEGAATMSNPEGKCTTIPLTIYKDTRQIQTILHGIDGNYPFYITTE